MLVRLGCHVFFLQRDGESDNGGGDMLARRFSNISYLFSTQLNLFPRHLPRRMLNFSATVYPFLHLHSEFSRRYGICLYIAPYADKSYVISYALCMLMVQYKYSVNEGANGLCKLLHGRYK